MGKKLKVITACWGVTVAVGIVVTALLVLIGWEDKIWPFCLIHFTMGATVIFIAFWPVFSNKLK